MKKMNFYFNFSRVYQMLAIVAAMFVAFSATAQAPSCDMNCIKEINYSLTKTDAANCETPVSPADLLSVGGLVDLFQCLGGRHNPFDAQTQVKRSGVWVPALGAGDAIINASDVGKKLEVRVVVFNEKTGATLNSCWGYVNVEDKQAPVIKCPKDLAIYCFQIPKGQVAPFPTQTGDLGLDNPTAAAVKGTKYEGYNTLLPGAADGAAFDCTGLMEGSASTWYMKDQTYTDCVFETPCDYPYSDKTAPSASDIAGHCDISRDAAFGLAAQIQGALAPPPGRLRDVSKIIIRCWRATDHYGNVSDPCYQLILVRGIDIYKVKLTQEEVIVSCKTGGDADCKLPGVETLNDGVIFYDINDNGTQEADEPTIPVKDGESICGLTVVRMADKVFPLCPGSKKIMRTWTAKDWCSGKVKDLTQKVEIIDTHQPIVRTSYVDYGYDCGEICMVDAWGVKKAVRVQNSAPAFKNIADFTGFEKQCGADKAGNLIPVFPLGDANTCGKYFVRFTFVACDPNCTNDEVSLTSSHSGLMPRKVRNFTNADGFNTEYIVEGYITLTKILPEPLDICGYTNYTAYDDITFKATDKCGYALAKQTFRILGQDFVKPQPVCISNHTATLGTDGTVRVNAASFNNGSSDNCGIQMVMVKRNDNKVPTAAGNGNCGLADDVCTGTDASLGGTYRDYVDFGCADAGKTIMVTMIVLDQLGNWNTCMINVTIQNKDIPTCFAPESPKAIACTYEQATLAKLMADPNSFGTAAAYYNCGYKLVEKEIKYNPAVNCTPASIVRSWEVLNCDGSAVLVSADKCKQTINFYRVSDFTVDFPDDITLNCYGKVPSAEELKKQMLDPTSFNKKDGAIKNDGCGVLAIDIETESVEADPGVCYKLIRKIKVIDWCKYNPNNDLVDSNKNPYGDPVCGDVHGYYGGTRAGNLASWQDLDTYRNEDCNGDGVIDNKASATSRDISHFDRRFRDADGLGGPKGSFQDGIICFNQIIKVIDSDKPETWGGDIALCNDKGKCSVSRIIELEATDKCDDGYATAEGLVYSWSLYKRVDASKADGTTDVLIAQNSVKPYTPDNKVPFEYGPGTYIIKWLAKDKCGNESNLTIQKITVSDCEKPSILSHDKNASLGIQVVQGVGMVVVKKAYAFNGASDNCTSFDVLLKNLRISKSNVSSWANAGEEVMFTCDDLAVSHFQTVRLWTKDEAGNENFVETVITLQDVYGLCKPSYHVAGAVKTENNAAINNVTVSATTGSTIAATSTSSATGEFLVANLTAGNYQVKASKTDAKDAYTGVTTFDIARISKHLLEIEKLGSAYQIIAADVDKNGEIDAADMLHIRNFILRKTNSLPGGIWRFVDKSYAFKNASNPFAEDFSEVVSLNDMKVGTSAANFVAVKLGDVNQNYSASATSTVVRNAQVLNFSTEDKTLSAGNEYTINISAENFNAAAFQGTLSFNGATVKSVKSAEGLNDGNFGQFNNAVTMSWNGTTELKGIVSVTFVANKTAKLSEVLTLGSELTTAEANATNGAAMNVALKFTNGKVSGGEFALYQNTPNPVASETSIRFNLPSESSAKLTIYDVQGKVVLVKQGEFNAGVNEFRVSKSEMTANGVLYYRLDTPEHSGTKKMIIME